MSVITRRGISRAMVRKAAKSRRSKVSGLELLVREWLDNAGIPYKTQYPVGLCHVDLMLESNLIVEINGCYWHGHNCQKVILPTQRRWRAKDQRRYRGFFGQGYKLMLIWECDVHKHGEEKVIAHVRRRLSGEPE